MTNKKKPTKEELLKKYASYKDVRQDGTAIETSDGGRIELSPLAKRLRNDRINQYHKDHPEKTKRYVNAHWENKAKELYGKDYKGPSNPDEMSEHAKEARRKYWREYQRKNPDKVKQYSAKYWERKARELLAEIEAGKEG